MLFLFEISRQNLVDGVFRWQRYKRHVLGNILPVVDEKRFEMVWYMYTHRGAQVEIFFLEIICSVSKLDSSFRSFGQVIALLLDTVHKVLRGVLFHRDPGPNESLGTGRSRRIVVPN